MNNQPILRDRGETVVKMVFFVTREKEGGWMREFRAVRDDGDTRNDERDNARRRATGVAVRTREPVVTLERSSRGLRRLVPRHSNAPSSRSDSKRSGEKQDGTRSFGSPVHGPSGLT